MSDKLIEQLKIMIMGLVVYDLTRVIENNRKVWEYSSQFLMLSNQIFTHPDKLNLAIESLSKPETKNSII